MGCSLLFYRHTFWENIEKTTNLVRLVLGEYTDSENTQPTNHPKDLIAKVSGEGQAQTQSFEKLRYATLNGISDRELVQTLKTMVPEFNSENSVYEELDWVLTRSPKPFPERVKKMNWKYFLALQLAIISKSVLASNSGVDMTIF